MWPTGATYKMQRRCSSMCNSQLHNVKSGAPHALQVQAAPCVSLTGRFTQQAPILRPLQAIYTEEIELTSLKHVFFFVFNASKCSSISRPSSHTNNFVFSSSDQCRAAVLIPPSPSPPSASSSSSPPSPPFSDPCACTCLRFLLPPTP